VRSWAMLVEALGGVRAFEHIVHTVRTGEPGIETAHGMGIFEFLAQNPTNAANFDAAMAERTAAFAPSVAADYDFSRMRTVVDVGGGQGILLAAILRRHTHLRGILFEVPTVVAGAEAVLMASDIADRSEVRAGDFFDRVPDGADGYVMANVLHDWDDARAVEILGNCRRAMTEDGRVLIVERLIPDDPSEAAPVLLSDINMLVFTGGQERTNAEYGQILTAARMRRGKVLPVVFPYGVIEGLTA
jgi:spermidine synthase